MPAIEGCAPFFGTCKASSLIIRTPSPCKRQRRSVSSSMILVPIVDLFDRISACVHASGESSLESTHLLVVSGLGIVSFLLHLCSCRLCRLFLSLFVRCTLPSSAAHSANGCADGCSPASISSNGSDSRSAQGSSRGSADPATLRLWRIRGGLLLSCLNVCCGGT